MFLQIEVTGLNENDTILENKLKNKAKIRNKFNF